MNNENLNATLRCVTRPSAAQEEKIKTFLKNKYQAENITLTISIDPIYQYTKEQYAKLLQVNEDIIQYIIQDN